MEGVKDVMAGVEVGREGRNLYPCVVDKRSGNVYGGKEGTVIIIGGDKVMAVEAIDVVGLGRKLVRFSKRVAEVNLEDSIICPGEAYGGVELTLPKK